MMVDDRETVDFALLARQLDAQPGHGVWAGGEWALLRGVHFAWLVTRAMPEHPRPFVSAADESSLRLSVTNLGLEGLPIAPLPGPWLADTLRSESQLADALARMSDGRAALRLLRSDEREVLVGDELCSLSPVPPHAGQEPRVSARQGSAAFAALERHVHEGTLDDFLEPLPAGYFARACAAGVYYGPQIRTLSTGLRFVGRVPPQRDPP